MPSAAEREAKQNEFLGLAGQAERLLATSPDHTLYDPEKLQRFVDLYGPQLREIVGNRDGVLAQPALFSAASLQELIDDAHKTLDVWDDPRP